MPKLVPILEFAYRIGFTNFYDWQCKILLRYEAGEPTAAACANYTGKISVIFPICALWTLANFSRSRLPQGGNSRGSRRDWQPVRSCQQRGQPDDRATTDLRAVVNAIFYPGATSIRLQCRCVGWKLGKKIVKILPQENPVRPRRRSFSP